MKRGTWSITAGFAAVAGVAAMWLGHRADRERRALELELEAQRQRKQSQALKVEWVDPRRINASASARSRWVVEQACGPGAWLFSRDYEWILSSSSIGPKEAEQLAYLFFYSTDVKGGYFDDPIIGDGVYKLSFHPELGNQKGFPVFVDMKTGAAWQEGQTEKIDTLALIRLFVATKAKQISTSDTR